MFTNDRGFLSVDDFGARPSTASRRLQTALTVGKAASPAAPFRDVGARPATAACVRTTGPAAEQAKKPTYSPAHRAARSVESVRGAWTSEREAKSDAEEAAAAQALVDCSLLEQQCRRLIASDEAVCRASSQRRCVDDADAIAAAEALRRAVAERQRAEAEAARGADADELDRLAARRRRLVEAHNAARFDLELRERQLRCRVAVEERLLRDDMAVGFSSTTGMRIVPRDEEAQRAVIEQREASDRAVLHVRSVERDETVGRAALALEWDGLTAEMLEGSADAHARDELAREYEGGLAHLLRHTLHDVRVAIYGPHEAALREAEDNARSVLVDDEAFSWAARDAYFALASAEGRARADLLQAEGSAWALTHVEATSAVAFLREWIACQGDCTAAQASFYSERRAACEADEEHHRAAVCDSVQREAATLGKQQHRINALVPMLDLLEQTERQLRNRRFGLWLDHTQAVLRARRKTQARVAKLTSRNALFLRRSYFRKLKIHAADARTARQATALLGANDDALRRLRLATWGDFIAARRRSRLEAKAVSLLTTTALFTTRRYYATWRRFLILRQLQVIGHDAHVSFTNATIATWRAFVQHKTQSRAVAALCSGSDIALSRMRFSAWRTHAKRTVALRRLAPTKAAAANALRTCYWHRLRRFAQRQVVLRERLPALQQRNEAAHARARYDSFRRFFARRALRRRVVDRDLAPFAASIETQRMAHVWRRLQRAVEVKKGVRSLLTTCEASLLRTRYDALTAHVARRRSDRAYGAKCAKAYLLLPRSNYAHAATRFHTWSAFAQQRRRERAQQKAGQLLTCNATRLSRRFYMRWHYAAHCAQPLATARAGAERALATRYFTKLRKAFLRGVVVRRAEARTVPRMAKAQQLALLRRYYEQLAARAVQRAATAHGTAGDAIEVAAVVTEEEEGRARVTQNEERDRADVADTEACEAIAADETGARLAVEAAEATATAELSDARAEYPDAQQQHGTSPTATEAAALSPEATRNAGVATVQKELRDDPAGDGAAECDPAAKLDFANEGHSADDVTAPRAAVAA